MKTDYLKLARFNRRVALAGTYGHSDTVRVDVPQTFTCGLSHMGPISPALSNRRSKSAANPIFA